MLLELTFNNLNNSFVKDLIRDYNERFKDFIQYVTSKRDVENLEEYKNENKADNIFLKLESELK